METLLRLPTTEAPGEPGAAASAEQPLDMRNKRYQAAFLESLQALKAGHDLRTDDGPVRIWLDSQGKYLFWQRGPEGEGLALHAPFRVEGRLPPLVTAAAAGSVSSINEAPCASMRVVSEGGADAAAANSSISETSSPWFHFAPRSTSEVGKTMSEATAAAGGREAQRDALTAMSCLASVRFAYWWQENEGSSLVEETPENKPPLAKFHLWQAARVALLEMAGDSGARQAWEAVAGALATLRAGTLTPWKLPLQVDLA